MVGVKWVNCGLFIPKCNINNNECLLIKWNINEMNKWIESTTSFNMEKSQKYVRK